MTDQLIVSMSASELIEMIDIVSYYARGEYDGGQMAKDFMDKELSPEGSACLTKLTESLSESFQNN